jgi:hypothetical protein
VPKFKRLREWFRPSPKSAEDLAAEQEAKALREQMETRRVGSRAGGTSGGMYGDRESRGG